MRRLISLLQNLISNEKCDGKLDMRSEEVRLMMCFVCDAGSPQSSKLQSPGSSSEPNRNANYVRLQN